MSAWSTEQQQQKPFAARTPLLSLLHRQPCMSGSGTTAAAPRPFATSPDRAGLIDERLKLLSSEHEALQKQLHGKQNTAGRAIG